MERGRRIAATLFERRGQLPLTARDARDRCPAASQLDRDRLPDARRGPGDDGNPAVPIPPLSDRHRPSSPGSSSGSSTPTSRPRRAGPGGPPGRRAERPATASPGGGPEVASELPAVRPIPEVAQEAAQRAGRNVARHEAGKDDHGMAIAAPGAAEEGVRRQRRGELEQRPPFEEEQARSWRGDRLDGHGSHNTVRCDRRQEPIEGSACDDMDRRIRIVTADLPSAERSSGIRGRVTPYWWCGRRTLRL
jgi:hypothetical protein